MNLKIFVRAEAELDILEAAKWYEKNLVGLGEKYLISVESALDSIQRNPEAFPKVHNDIRRILLKKFPFGLFYLVDKGRIIVLAVFHASRNPKHWKERTK